MYFDTHTFAIKHKIPPVLTFYYSVGSLCPRDLTVPSIQWSRLNVFVPMCPFSKIFDCLYRHIIIPTIRTSSTIIAINRAARRCPQSTDVWRLSPTVRASWGTTLARSPSSSQIKPKSSSLNNFNLCRYRSSRGMIVDFSPVSLLAMLTNCGYRILQLVKHQLNSLS